MSPFPTHKSNTPLPPKTLWSPQDISFRPLYGYKYSIFLWVTCSYRKECSLKKQWAAGCSLPSFACSYSCLFNLYLHTSQKTTQPPTNSRQKTVAQPSPKKSCHKKNSTQIILKMFCTAITAAECVYSLTSSCISVIYVTLRPSHYRSHPAHRYDALPNSVLSIVLHKFFLVSLLNF